MKLLLDQGLPRSAAILLREKSVDTVHTGEIGCSTLDDKSILELARKEDRIVVTLDADFHAILALSKSVSPSVIRIRIEGLRGESVAGLLLSILSTYLEDLKLGAVVTIQPNRTRIKNLPLIP